MKKINIKVRMISDNPEENNYEGIFNNDIISYIENSNTKVKVELINSIITREDEEKLLIIDYRRKNIHLNLKEYNYEFDMPIKQIEESLNNNCFSLKYELDEKIIEYILEYEEI